MIAKGDTSWRIIRHDNLNGGRLVFGTDYAGPAEKNRKPEQDLEGTTDVGDGAWHLTVITYEPGRDRACKRLYIDGRLEAEARESPLCVHNARPVWLGDSEYPNHEFKGLIDEVAILSRAFKAAEVAAMFAAGKPAGTVTEREPGQVGVGAETKDIPSRKGGSRP